MSGRPVNTPDRSVIVRIAREEAVRFGVGFDDVVGLSSAPTVLEARHAAMRRVVEETGCSVLGLSWAWGCGRDAARRAFAPEPMKKNSSAPKSAPEVIVPSIGAYDMATIRCLAEAHPPQRVADIIAGRDPATNNDIAAWRRLGSGSAAPRSTPVEI